MLHEFEAVQRADARYVVVTRMRGEVSVAPRHDVVPDVPRIRSANEPVVETGLCEPKPVTPIGVDLCVESCHVRRNGAGAADRQHPRA